MKCKCEARGLPSSQRVWRCGEQIGVNKELNVAKFLDSLTQPNLILFAPTRCSTCLLPYAATEHANPAVYLAGRGISIEFNLMSICGLSAESKLCFRRAAVIRKNECMWLIYVLYNDDPSSHLLSGRYS